jgi:hypothetical protein
VAGSLAIQIDDGIENAAFSTGCDDVGLLPPPLGLTRGIDLRFK